MDQEVCTARADQVQFNTLGDQRSPVELQVTGHIPALAVGTLYRTGPGGYKVRRTEGDKENFACSHWFDGFTTVHKFDIVLNGNKSKVVYSSYCQVDELIERARRTGRMNVMSFGQKRDPCDSLYKKFKSIFMPPFPNPTPHSSNVGVTFRETLPTEKALAESASRRLLTVATDTHQTKTFDADTLEPLGLAVQSQLHPDLTGPFSGAHAAHDPETGDVFNYNLSPGRKAVYRVFRASLSGKVEILAEISGHDIHAAYLHSMFITADFLVLCIWPAFYRYMGLSVLWHRNMLDAIEPFDSSSKATWVVVDRKHGRGVVKKFTTPGFFSFHTINAWQEKQKDGVLDIICELAQFDSLDILHTFYYENMVSNESHVGTTGEKLRSKLAGGIARHRLSGIPLSGNSTSTTEAEKIMNIAFPNAGDLPRINPQYALKQHRYVYSVATRHRSSFMGESFL